MTRHQDSKGELRAAFTLRELDRARASISTGTIGVFLRVTLAITFMYLIVFSYLVFGATGPVFVSVLFLIAFFVPLLYRAVHAYLPRRKEQPEAEARNLEPGIQQ